MTDKTHMELEELIDRILVVSRTHDQSYSPIPSDSSAMPRMAYSAHSDIQVEDFFNQSATDGVSEDSASAVRIATALWVYASPVILAIGTVGSILSLLVLSRKALRVHTTMFYLAALAVSDLMVLYTGLIRLWLERSQGIYLRLTSRAACKIHTSMVYVSLDLSVWILVAVTIDRCLYISKPHFARRWCTLRNSRIAIAIMVFLACAVNIHFLWTYDLEQDEKEQIYAHGGKRCYAATGSVAVVKFVELVWPWLDFCKFCLFPFIIMGVCNTIIIIHLIRNERKMAAHNKLLTKRILSDKTAAKNSSALAKNVEKADLPDAEFGHELASLPTEEDSKLTGRKLPYRIDSPADDNVESLLETHSDTAKSLKNEDVETVSSSVTNSYPARIPGEKSNSQSYGENQEFDINQDRSITVEQLPMQAVPSSSSLTLTTDANAEDISLNNQQNQVGDIHDKAATTSHSRGFAGSSQQLPKPCNSQPTKLPTSDPPMGSGVKTAPDVIEDPNGSLSPSNVLTHFEFKNGDDDQEDLLPPSPTLPDNPVTSKRKRISSNKIHPEELSHRNSEEDKGMSKERDAIHRKRSSVEDAKENGIELEQKDNPSVLVTDEDKRDLSYQSQTGLPKKNIDSGKTAVEKSLDTTNNQQQHSVQLHTNSSQTGNSARSSCNFSSFAASDKQPVTVANEILKSAPSRHHISSITKTLLVITVTFWIFNAPIVIFVIGHTYWSAGADQQTQYNIVLGWAAVNLLQYLNNTMHMFLYCLTSSVFRHELVEMFKSMFVAVKGWIQSCF